MIRSTLTVLMLSACLILALGASTTGALSGLPDEPQKKPKPAPPPPPAPPETPAPPMVPPAGPAPVAPMPPPAPQPAPAPVAPMAAPVPPQAVTPPPPPSPPEQPLPMPPPVEEGPDWITAVIPVQNVDVWSLAQALAIFNARILPNRDLKVLAVKASPETIAALQETIQRLDQPSRAHLSVEVIAYLLMASPSPGATGDLPAAVQKLLTPLQSTLGFQSVRLLESTVLRCRDNGDRCSASGVIPSPQPNFPEMMYNFRCRCFTRNGPEAQGRFIQLDDLELGVRIPVPASADEKPPRFAYRDAGFQTGLDIREGQTAIVGKASLQGTTDALILAVTARVVD